MELFIKEILSGNNAVTGLAILAIYLMHKSASDKLDKLTKAVEGVVTGLAVTSEKLDHGDTRMTKIEDKLESTSSRLHKTNQDVMINKEKVKRLEDLVNP